MDMQVSCHIRVSMLSHVLVDPTGQYVIGDQDAATERQG